jgi:multidrug efflux pump subunit AcrA (membrane-fusion protein)
VRRARDQDVALEPMRAAMLSAAAANAAGTIANARAAAAAQLQDSRSAAEAAIAQAAAEGASSARSAAAAEVARSRRIARSMILEAEQALYQDLSSRIRTAVLALRHQAGYPEFRRRLIERAASAAGPGAVIADPDNGGVIATAPGVVVDCSLNRLADQAIAIVESSIITLCASSPSSSSDLPGEIADE